MKSFTLIALLFIMAFSVEARKPAVEAFVGVEPEMQVKVTPETKVSFNFDQYTVKSTTTNGDSAQGTSFWFAIGSLLTFLGLPLMLWFGITSLKKSEETTEAYLAKDHNSEDEKVTHLSDYKYEEDEVKKAS